TSIFTYPKEVYIRIANKVSAAIGHTFSYQNVMDALINIFNNVYHIESLDGKAWSFEVDESGQQFFKIKADLLDSSIADKVNYMNTLSQKIAKDGEFRGQLTSELVNHAINGVYIKIDEK